MKKVFLGILVVLFLLIAVILFNTFTLKSIQVEPTDLEEVSLSDSALQHLSTAITFPTISVNEDTEPDSAAFNGFHEFLRKAYPRIHATMELQKISNYSLLYTWKGKDESQQPLVFMSHMDVVPVDEPTLNDWEAPPFSGKITDTHIIGRGSMDDKSTLMANMEAIELLLNEGFQPNQTIYLAFGHDEEIGGRNGAAKIAEHLKENGVTAALVLDEGGFVGEGMLPGVNKPVAMINVVEKGFASFNLRVETSGGHSSAPPRENTVGMLAQAIVDLENNQLPYRMVDPLEEQMKIMGPELPFVQKMAFANSWLFKGMVMEGLNAHTTTAPTIIKGGVKSNVIPTVAEATINFRILPGETIESVQEHIKNTISDKVQVEPVGFLTNPSPASGIDTKAYLNLQTVIRSMYPTAIVVPGLLGGGTDARYFYDISESVYRFYPMKITPENMKGFHGIDEKIEKENYLDMIRFCYHLIKRF